MTTKKKNITAMGIDLYNLCLTGDIGRTITAARNDNEHMPCVLITNTNVDTESSDGCE